MNQGEGMETIKLYRQDGKKWKLPEVLCFEGLQSFQSSDKLYFYEILEYREPKAGQYFLSGAIPQAYQAPNDLSQKYLVIEKREKAISKQIYVRDGSK